MDIQQAEYLKEIAKRGKESKVYQPHQLLGLEIAEMLRDDKHKALYIKLAKKHDSRMLRGLAKDISENAKVLNKGAYFMTRLKDMFKTK